MKGNLYLRIDRYKNDSYTRLNILTVKDNLRVDQSSTIYISNPEIVKIVESKDSATFDYHNYFRTSTDYDKVLTVFAALNGSEKEIYEYVLDHKKLVKALNDSLSYKKSFIRLKNSEVKAKLIQKFTAEHLQTVLSEKHLKRKFIKHLLYLLDTQHTEVELYNDFAPHSFYFIKLYKGNYHYNGGLICHHDYKDPDNLRLAKYSIHT